MEIDEDKNENSLEFARRVMRATAHHLNMLASPFLYSDKKKWLLLKSKMRQDGYEFSINTHNTTKSVEVSNIMKRPPQYWFAWCCNRNTNKIEPHPVTTTSSDDNQQSNSVGSTDSREKLLGYIRDTWGMSKQDFTHLAFVQSSSSSSSGNDDLCL